ncbi:MAG: MATE family efflux transporter, partial [Chitinophagales bacterium]|nr:MATE family efflux transporter [Chitinophagales bacterium]MDW8273905.1 MATE family efflux transporter [Chitinophagales bacterium]
MLNTGSEYVKAVKKTALIGFPITAGHLSHVLMGFFDTIQVGGLGPDYIAASGVATAVYWLFTLIGTGILFVVAPMIAEAFGEKKPAKAVSIFKDSIALAGVISFITTIFFFLLIKKFEWFGQPKHINILAIKYLWIVNFSTPALIFFTAGRQMLEGLGKTTPVMIINFSGLVCNVALNDILIYGKIGLPAMGIQGAATATCITRYLQLIAIFFVLFR